MKVICQTADMTAALSQVSRALTNRSTLPVLECIKLTAEKGKLSLTGNDLHMGIESSLSAEVAEEGEVLLPGRLFGEIIRRLPDGEMQLQVNENSSAVIRAQGSRTTVQGLPSEDYPALPAVDEGNAVTIKQSLLRDMIRQTAFAIAVDESRPVLTGCLLEAQDDKMVMVALDGYRLALRRGEIAPLTNPISCVVPGRYLGELGRMLENGDEEITLRISPSHLHASFQNTSVIIRLLEGNFIRYNQIIPQDLAINVRTDKNLLFDCVDRASLMAREGKTNLVTFHLENNTLSITSNATMGDVYEELPVSNEGGEITIAFNVRYLADVLKSIDDDEVMLRFNMPITPCVITPVEGDSFLYLVLPVRMSA